jgi:hypothetical protein
VARTDVVLTVRYASAHAAGGPRGIGRFVRYVQYRDAHPDREEVHDLDGLIRYVHHRDRASPRGQLFDAAGPAGDEQRRDFVDYVARSTHELHRAARPRSTTSERAVYQFILSPRDARGLDLKRLTRTAMSRLAADTGRGDFPPWIAGEHRNTAHAHVHVILAARREPASGDFRTLVITKPRLAHMKEALHLEMTRQRDHRLTLSVPSRHPGRPELSLLETVAWTSLAHKPFGDQIQHHSAARVARLAAGAARRHRHEAERLARMRRELWDTDEDRSRIRRLR